MIESDWLIFGFSLSNILQRGRSLPSNPTDNFIWIVEETNPRGYYTTTGIVELRHKSDSVARFAVLAKLADERLIRWTYAIPRSV